MCDTIINYVFNRFLDVCASFFFFFLVYIRFIRFRIKFSIQCLNFDLVVFLGLIFEIWNFRQLGI